MKKGDSPQGGVKGITNVCQLIKRCDGHGKGVKVEGSCDSCEEV